MSTTTTPIDWPNEITFGDIERIRKEADVDLLRLVEAGDDGEPAGFVDVWADVVGNIGIGVNVLRLWLGVSDEEWFDGGSGWGKRFTGAAIKAGLERLEAALDDFFTETGQGKTFGILARKARQSGEIVTETLSKHLEQKLDDSLRQISESKSGDLLAALESGAPTLTPTGK